jgi:hypothetical protein
VGDSEELTMKNTLPLALALCAVSCTPLGEELPSENTDGDQALLAPPEAGKGIQLRMTMTADPGVERYGCQMFEVPTGGLFIHEEEVQFGPGGHHILLYKTPYAAIPDADERGEAVDAAAIHDCSKGVTARWKINSVMGGSETFGDKGMLRGLPEGVAVHVPEHTVLVMSVHYINTSPQPLDVDARMNLHTMAPEDVKMEAGLLYFDNHLLHVPAMGSSSARMRCPVPNNVSIVNLQSHMHARGTSFAASVFSGQNTKGTTVYDTTKWIEPPVEWYDPLLELTAGQAIELRCDYKNAEARNIGYGPQSIDEMCQLIGPYFPRDERFEACSTALGESAATWIGEGSVDGAGTADCVKVAPSIAVDGGFALASCVASSCPAIAEEVSVVARCRLDHQEDLCEAELAALSNATCAQ